MGRVKEEQKKSIGAGENVVRNEFWISADAPGPCNQGDRQEARNSFRITCSLLFEQRKARDDRRKSKGRTKEEQMMHDVGPCLRSKWEE